MSSVRFVYLKTSLFAVGMGAVLGVACAKDAGEVAGGTGGAATGNGGIPAYGTGGVGAGNTGNTGNGGTSSTGGMNVGGSIGGTVSGYTFAGTVTPAPGQTVSGDIISTFLSCASDGAAGDGSTTAACHAAHCVPEALTNSLAPASAALLGKCANGTDYCVPDDFIATLGKFILKTCTSVDGAEGRCLSTCVPEIGRLAYALPRDTCAPSELCAPCYYPWPAEAGSTGETGACSAGVGDAPTEPAHLFTTCGVVAPGTPQGLCVPASLVPANLKAAVPKDTCTGTDQLCAPTQKVKDLSYKFPTCSGGFGNGACVSKFLALYAGGDPISQLAAAAFAACPGNEAALSVVGTLPSDADWLCSPCIHPLTAQPTGACL